MLKRTVLSLLILSCHTLFAQQEQIPATRLHTRVKLTYRATWMGLQVGTGVIQVGKITEREGRYVIPISCCVSTVGFARALLKVDDCLSSLLDPEKLTPYRFQERIREASYSRDRVIEFDRQAKIGRVFRPENGRLVLDKEVPMEEDFHDFLSWTFFLSSQDVAIGQTFTFKVLTYQQVDETTLKVMSREQLSLSRLGKFQAYRVVPAGETGESIKKRGGAGEVWVDTENRLPLVISMKLPAVGSLKLVLEKIEEGGESGQGLSADEANR